MRCRAAKDKRWQRNTREDMCCCFFLIHFGDATELNAEYRHQLTREARDYSTVVVFGHHVNP